MMILQYLCFSRIVQNYDRNHIIIFNNICYDRINKSESSQPDLPSRSEIKRIINNNGIFIAIFEPKR